MSARRDSTPPLQPVLSAIAIHLARFGVIVLGSSVLAPALGISGWYIGLFTNALCVLFAVVLVSALRMWRFAGLRTLWRSRVAALWLVPFVAEVMLWLA